jgi:hypothetical protein
MLQKSTLKTKNKSKTTWNPTTSKETTATSEPTKIRISPRENIKKQLEKSIRKAVISHNKKMRQMGRRKVKMPVLLENRRNPSNPKHTRTGKSKRVSPIC